MCSMNTQKSIFFSQTSVRIQLNDARAFKSDRKQEIKADFHEVKKIYHFPSFQPEFNSTSNLDTERDSSYYDYRYQAVLTKSFVE